jgi:hypothetical protein
MVTGSGGVSSECPAWLSLCQSEILKLQLQCIVIHTQCSICHVHTSIASPSGEPIVWTWLCGRHWITLGNVLVALCRLSQSGGFFVC